MLIYPDTFTDDARTIMFHAQAHARRLGHTHVGGEHFLLALAAADVPVAAVLHEHGVTPERVEEEIVRLEVLGPAAALLAGLDAGALAAIGVDPGAVRGRLEASFGPDALARAGQATQEKPPRRPSGCLTAPSPAGAPAPTPGPWPRPLPSPRHRPVSTRPPAPRLPVTPRPHPAPGTP